MEELSDLTAIEPLEEEWRPVVGYERFYSVSSFGRVKREESLTPRPATAKRPPRLRWVKARILPQSPVTSGYLSVWISGDRPGSRKLVHILVAAAFLGPKPPGLIVLHGPMGKLSNMAMNLSYGTYSDNLVRDRIRDGTSIRGELAHCSRLTEHQVLEIRASSDSSRLLAARYGVVPSTIQSIRTRRTWRHVS